MNQIIGQEDAKQRLVHWWNSGTIPHAIMIKGQHGWGSLALAKAFIQYVFCSDKQGDVSCGKCANCLKNQKNMHPDVHFTFPSIAPKAGTKAMSQYFVESFRSFLNEQAYASAWDWLQYINAENRQGNISAEECRYIIDQLNLTAYEGGWKVQLIWMPEYLRENGNILLKLIEEPPAKTLIIFVAEQTEQVLATILSRVQILTLQPLSADEIYQKLKISFPEEDDLLLKQSATWGQGDYDAAMKIVASGVSNYLEIMSSWFNGIFGNNQFNLINDFVEYANSLGREQVKAILNYAQQTLAHLIKSKFQPSFLESLVKEEAAFISKFGRIPLSFEQVLSMQELIAQSIYHVERNVHVKTQLMALSVKLQGIYRNADLSISDFK